MRIRLAATVLAVTAMVTIAFLVPLGAVVRVVAADQALSAADQESRSLAGVLAAADNPASITAVLNQLNAGSQRAAAVFLPDGGQLGAPVKVSADELQLARAGRAFTASGSGGRRIWVPVREADGTTSAAVVAVPDRLLTKGVAKAWAALAGVGLLMVLIGVGLADRLAHSMVVSMEELRSVTERLHQGDLDARVEPRGPVEVIEVGNAVNELARRIGELLTGEREAAADLSHRLRTPLTALQLEAEGLSDPAERDRMGAAVHDLTDAVTTVIRAAREPRPPRRGAHASDLLRIVRTRLEFWSVLAEDQRRAWHLDAAPGTLSVGVAPDDLAAVVDALLANVFAHTPEGTGFRVAVVARNGGGGVLVVEDRGAGFNAPSPEVRGKSGAGSTGLGLDIVRRTAEASGGSMRLGRPTGGGAAVVVEFGGPRAGPPSSRR
jgi:signal transduction histidine kinase